ncbi:MAG: hypothetical protein K8S55_07975 [Phycisphaerae bacterium]|nr:hypothetical protein [Phycisphaerae bacterium]
MKFRNGIVLGLMITSLLAGIAHAQGKTTKTKKPTIKLSGEFARIASVGKCTYEQKKQLAVIEADMQKALDKWEIKAEKKARQIQKSMQQTKEAETKAALQKKLKKLKTDRKRLEFKYQDKAAALLTPEQKGAWLGPKLWQVISREFSGIRLDAKQRKEAMLLCSQAVQKAKADVANNKSLIKRTTKSIASKVLTKEQKKELKIIQKEKAKKEAAARRQKAERLEK